VLDHGQIVERGTHESLLQRAGLYHELHRSQARSRRRDGALVTATASVTAANNGHDNGNGP
jgi:hypothetical protein